MYELRNVRKSYRTPRGEVVALDDVDLSIGDGEWVVIKGPTGGGKSTLLQLLGALDRPDSGTVEWNGPGGTVRLDRLSEGRLTHLRARRIGFVFQSFNLIPTLTACDNVMAALRPVGVRGSAARERALRALDAVGLAQRAEHLPGMLSGGQQQRVAIARALVKDPVVLLADEPTGNLDERMRDEVMSVLRSVWAQRSVTVVIVTHDSALSDDAERVIHLDEGRVLLPV